MAEIELLKVKKFNIKIERKKIKNMYLKIKPSGEIRISAHPEITLEQINQFVLSKESWIDQKLTQIQQAPKQSLRADEFLFLGMKLSCVRQMGINVDIKLEGRQLVVVAPPGMPDEKLIVEIRKWQFKQLQLVINHYLKQYWPIFEKGGFQPIEIKYRQMKSTWGVCRPTRGSITFSKELIHQPETFIEYVVVHELCHLVQPNHSKKFYETVSSILPQWKVYSKSKI